MLRFTGMPTDHAAALRRGEGDAHGNPAEHAISDGMGNPCRHCLTMIETGASFLIASYRPFATRQPYAEQGPIFVHAEDCPLPEDDDLLPRAFDSPEYLLRGYGTDERIVYGTGGIVARDSLRSHAATLLARPDVTFVHIRSATNNCWQGRIEAV